jgi:hypothetical protein
MINECGNLDAEMTCLYRENKHLINNAQENRSVVKYNRQARETVIHFRVEYRHDFSSYSQSGMITTMKSVKKMLFFTV